MKSPRRTSPYLSVAEGEDSGAAPGWFVTYADLMSLLLAFFIMLAAMSDVRNETRVVQAVVAMQKQFGDADVAAPEATGIHPGRVGGPPVRPATFNKVRPGEPVMAGGVLVFEEDSAAIRPDQADQLRFIHEQFQGKLQKIEIRGHTTRRPLPADSPYRDLWQLSFARSQAAMDLLVSLGTDPRRIRLTAAAGNEPAYVGDDPYRRRDNSRVEVFLLNEFIVPAENAAP